LAHFFEVHGLDIFFVQRGDLILDDRQQGRNDKDHGLSFMWPERFMEVGENLIYQTFSIGRGKLGDHLIVFKEPGYGLKLPGSQLVALLANFLEFFIDVAWDVDLVNSLENRKESARGKKEGRKVQIPQPFFLGHFFHFFL